MIFARPPFTHSLKSMNFDLFTHFWLSCQSPLYWGPRDWKNCCNLLAISPPNPVSGVVGHAIDRCITANTVLGYNLTAESLAASSCNKNPCVLSRSSNRRSACNSLLSSLSSFVKVGILTRPAHKLIDYMRLGTGTLL